MSWIERTLDSIWLFAMKHDPGIDHRRGFWWGTAWLTHHLGNAIERRKHGSAV